ATLFADEQRAEFTARVDSRFPIAPGTEVELAVHTPGLHFFDRETGDVIDTGASARREQVSSNGA
ncbi:MAG TPA: hypothetical protein VF327_08255, partial [Gaiellaceae bacterium]